MRASSLAVLALLVAIAVAAVAAAAAPRPVLQGSWIATAGARQFRGQWSAQVLADNPNAAVGSWTLLDGANQIALQGTWSARKEPKRWRGTWSARAQTGMALSGTWEADAAKLTGKTFEAMLEQAAAKQISGSWRRGAARGNWWLSALPEAQRP